jgi:hypothetical protein
MSVVLESLAGERVTDPDQEQPCTRGDEDDVEHDELRI